jgi:hypothetical protein
MEGMSHFAYLKAANIAPIIIETREETGTTYIFGNSQRYDDQTLWVDARYRGRIIRYANRVAGPKPSRERMIAALNEAAKTYRQKLTPHLIVIARAARLSKQLDDTLEQMRANGMLKFFHQEYAKHRRERIERGVGYMNFATAQRRLRNAIIARLVGDRESVSDSGLIELVLLGKAGSKLIDEATSNRK